MQKAYLSQYLLDFLLSSKGQLSFWPYLQVKGFESVLGALEQTVGVGVICTYPKVGSTEHWIRRYPSPLKPLGPKLVPCKFIYFRKDLLSTHLYFPFSIKDICYIQLYSHRHTMFFLCFGWTFHKLKVKIIHQQRLRLTLLQWSGTGPAVSAVCLYILDVWIP